MLFNSLAFLLLALPGALVLHGLVQRFRPGWRPGLLLALSFAFYATFDLRFVPLLAASIGLNWAAARLFARTGQVALIALAIALNLALLGAFKYLDFFAGLGGLAGLWPATGEGRFALALPLGISFFTFQHIMYLGDLKAGRAVPTDLLRYGLYVAFFPRVIAGPLVRASEFLPQLDGRPSDRPDDARRAAQGLMLLGLGLGKKVFLGDPLGDVVDPIFAAAAAGATPSVQEAWLATLGYTFQLYFDFSGYTDMALGIALLFGIVLPPNFDAPYRAISLQDFWRRWHMTLSRFLRDYLYIPFGGNRHGFPRQVLALVGTMTLGGLWHGAGLTFVAWGLAHGLGLAAGLVWRRSGLALPVWLSAGLTFAFVALAWVLFRATSFPAALAIYRGLFGLAPQGGLPDLRLLAVAATIAIVGPTSAELVRRLAPARWIAVAAALLALAVLLAVGDDANRDFVYAQF